jgi:hypothetical protein
MVNYQLGKVYKIIDLDFLVCYIGSPSEPTLAQRLAKHVANNKAYTKGTGGYCTSYSIIEKDDYDILLIENIHAITKLNSIREKAISRRSWLVLQN